MANWKKVKLEEICSVEWGNSELTKASYNPDGEYLAVSAAGCDGRIGHREHAKNTPVISAIGANCGRMFLPREDFTAIKNTITITPIDGVADGRYLYEVLTFTELPKRGGAQPFMSKGDIESFKIGVPPIAEQRKIAEILRTWDEAIETAEAELKAKQERKRWLMHKLLTCPSEHNGALHQNTWTTVGLGEVASFQNGEAFSSRFFNSENRGLRLVRNRDLKNDDQIIFYDGEYSAKDVVSDGDLLVGMDGDFTPVIWSKGKALLNQRVGRITVKPEISKSYIYYTLYSVLTELEHVTSATTVKHLSSKGCLLLKIPMPPFTSQCLISGILQSADADIQVITQRIESLRAQKRGLMQKLLTGEVRVAA